MEEIGKIIEKVIIDVSEQETERPQKNKRKKTKNYLAVE